MADLGQFIIFSFGMVSLYSTFRISAAFARYWLTRRLISLQIENAVIVNQALAHRGKVDYDPEVVEIAEQILIQMHTGLKYQHHAMMRHAIEHIALLYRTDVWLTRDVMDPKVHDALDVIKQKFYYMHGTFVGRKKGDLRNHILLQLFTPSGEPVPAEQELRGDSKNNLQGCRINVVMSLVTPLTSRKYRFIKYL